MEFYLKHKKVLIRIVGIFLLIIGIGAHFWTKPKEGNAVISGAAQNVARMEASVKKEHQQEKKVTPGDAIAQAYLTKQQEQMRYMTIFIMLIGGGFLIYSFLKRED